jgi:cell division protein ZapA
MSIGEKGICVRILEKEFRIACAKNQEQALRDAAQYLDKQMRLIRQGGRVIGLERIAVMAAMNIAHELLSLKNASPQVGDAFSERLKVLQEKIDGALSQTPSASEMAQTLKQQDARTKNPKQREEEHSDMQLEAIETV